MTIRHRHTNVFGGGSLNRSYSKSSRDDIRPSALSLLKSLMYITSSSGRLWLTIAKLTNAMVGLLLGYCANFDYVDWRLEKEERMTAGL